MIAGQLAFRGWALAGSWFHLDDLFLLDEARDGVAVTQPYYSHIMVWGRTVAALVADGGLVDWHLAVIFTLLSQCLASIACAWMLVTLFGARPGVLALLAIYLSSAMLLPTTMWWSAGLQALPVQITVFGAVGTWVRYLRTGRSRWLALTLVLFALGLLSYIKAMVLLPILGWLALAYFTDGSAFTRLRTALRRWWLAFASALALGGGYLAYYLTHAEKVSTGSIGKVVGPLAQTMLGRALATGMLGGPWRWDNVAPPAAIADPPAWTVQVAWVSIALAAAYWALTRERTGRAWVLLAGHALISFALLLATRAPYFGAQTGGEYRYLADVTCTWILVLGLVTMPLLGSAQGSAPRDEPLLKVAASRRLVGLVVLAVVVSGVASTLRYVSIWHTTNPTKSYFETARADILGTGTVDLIQQAVPEHVIPNFWYPHNLTTDVLPGVVGNVDFPMVSDDMHMLDANGHVRPAEIKGWLSAPAGDVPDCGWKVQQTPVTVPLDDQTLDYTWWVSFGYLASEAATVEVRAGDSVRQAPVRRGLGTTFVRVDGSVSSVTLRVIDPGATMCVDKIKVGTPTPGAAS